MADNVVLETAERHRALKGKRHPLISKEREHTKKLRVAKSLERERDFAAASHPHAESSDMLAQNSLLDALGTVAQEATAATADTRMTATKALKRVIVAWRENPALRATWRTYDDLKAEVVALLPADRGARKNFSSALSKAQAKSSAAAADRDQKEKHRTKLLFSHKTSKTTYFYLCSAEQQEAEPAFPGG